MPQKRELNGIINMLLNQLSAPSIPKPLNKTTETYKVFASNCRKNP